MGLIKKVFGDYSERQIKKIQPIVDEINSLETVYERYSDRDLRAKTDYFKSELANGKTLDDILPEAFAVVREASKRVLGMRHFDVQLIGGIILHQGRIAEMKTGEGKTLVATLPVYLNALTGKGVHVVTVNDYLAKRDSEWMGKLYRFLGLSVGLIYNRMPQDDKHVAYQADVTYGTNNEFGFDYLRDNMVMRKEDMVQRELNYAIVDEIDSILIDEARTPLIISGRDSKASVDQYKKVNAFVSRLEPKVIIEEDVKDVEQVEDNEKYDYIVDLKSKSASLTQKGIEKAEKEFGLENLNDLDNSELVHDINQALRAHGIMKRDVDYIVKDGEILIVDDNTGRIMYGRRYNEGLHQAIEAKEGVKVREESKTLATITFQNYFRMYTKLSGMTGTAMTEEEEFREIYSLDVVAIPTNMPMIRDDQTDVIYRNERAKFNAVIEDIKASHEKGQPVVVGTVSVENSEKLSKLLNDAGIEHEVLNAKNHEKEAEIIAQAGKYGAVTIATNMAGRGTDIILGGNSEYLAKQEMRKLKYSEPLIEQATAYNETDDQEIIDARKKYKDLVEKYDAEIKDEKEKVLEAGGLKIIGTERHESRRIDNQLRGRSGRQGDPGESRFYLALDDDLLKIFGGDTIARIYDRVDVPEDMPIEAKLLSRTIENAQSKVESRNFSIRKHILSYDDVMNVQRNLIYDQRREVIDGKDIRQNIVDMIDSSCDMIVDTFRSDIEENKLSKEALQNEIRVNLNLDNIESLDKDQVDADEVLAEIKEKALKSYEQKEKDIGEEIREVERVVLLKVVDTKWMDHIDAMDILKNGIGLRAYGQKDPVVQYRQVGADMFDEMVGQIRLEVSKIMLHIIKKGMNIKREPVAEVTGERLDDSYREEEEEIDITPEELTPRPSHSNSEKPEPYRNEAPKVGRNDPCPCGSGKKYKNCCGKNA